MPCDHNCINTNGSFLCSCRTGFVLNNNDKRSCSGMLVFAKCAMMLMNVYLTDVDECKIASLDNTDLCSGVMQCLNTEGSYECLCPYGFTNTNGSCLSKCNIIQNLMSSCFHTCQLFSNFSHTISNNSFKNVFYGRTILNMSACFFDGKFHLQ